MATKPIESPSGARRALAFGSAALAALGATMTAYGAFARSASLAGWLAFVLGVLGLAAAAVWSTFESFAPTPPAHRRAIVVGVGVALLAQALIPLRYYLGDDAYDERFSWRMFSAVRLQECAVSADETVAGVARPIDLERTIHVAWVTTLRRNREGVVERFLAWRCEQPDVEQARLVTRCTSASGARVPPIERTLRCADGTLTRVDGIR